ncbi:undecaprenyl pyrophosphate synthetase family protein [Actinidia rufa]|uniref:Alkyl transferase n=1 Tax=Actinidia rufa TaxID=165716 RepID=A0A7J0GRV2_9ERIC|nr:undecaprenyl pyrophosphate synthetase family protein [Actinidia rufa]
MDKESGRQASNIFGNLGSFLRKCIFRVLSVGPVPKHIAFVMDGNRRYAKKRKLTEGAGHRIGFFALTSMLKYCYELGVKYVTIYAFSIDNFKRRPEEVQSLMEFLQEKIEGLLEEESIVNRYGVRVYFIGNLKLLSKSVRLAAERAMAATASNSKAVLSICVAYTSTDEIVHAVQESCEEWDEIKVLDPSGSGYGLIALEGNELNQGDSVISLAVVEKHMYMGVAPDPDIIIRTSGETRLSNFLLWQSAFSHLYSPPVLWPEIGFRHLLWAVLDFQRNFIYLEERKKVVQIPQIDRDRSS